LQPARKLYSVEVEVPLIVPVAYEVGASALVVSVAVEPLLAKARAEPSEAGPRVFVEAPCCLERLAGSAECKEVWGPRVEPACTSAAVAARLAALFAEEPLPGSEDRALAGADLQEIFHFYGALLGGLGVYVVRKGKVVHASNHPPPPGLWIVLAKLASREARWVAGDREILLAFFNLLAASKLLLEGNLAEASEVLDEVNGLADPALPTLFGPQWAALFLASPGSGGELPASRSKAALKRLLEESSELFVLRAGLGGSVKLAKA